MKKIAITSTLSALLAASSYGDIVYTAPGMAAASSSKGTSINKNVALGEFYEYQITGVDWQLGAGTPPAGMNGSGKFNKDGGTRAVGNATLSVSIAGHTILSGASLSGADDISDRSSGSVDFSDNPIIIKAQNVNMVINQVTNMTGDSSSYVAIRGICLKDPPIPTGDLDVSSLVREGATPQVDWVIRREGVYGTAPSFNLADTSWTSSSGGGGGGGGGAGGSSGTEAPNAGKNKTNNGHGNNLDGVDVSNPGKSAEKWAARGIIDESGSYDDEGKGGGAAPSN